MTIATKGKDSLEGITGDKYFRLIEHAADGITIIQDGVFKLVNTALTRISGYDKEDLLGMPFTKLLTPESQKLTMARYQARLAGKKVPHIYEIKAVTKNGEIRDIEINAALTEYDGRVADEIIIRDITERKQVEAALKESEEKFSKAFRASPEAISIFRLKDNIFIEVNESFTRFTGYTREEVINHNVDEFNLWVYEEERARMLQIVQEQGRVYKEEYHSRMKSGEIRVGLFSGELISLHGEPCMTFVITDITERKQAEEALQTERNKLQSVIGAMEDDLSIQDKDYNIIYQNEQSRKSSGGDRTGEKCYRAYENRDKVCDGCPVKKAFKDGKSHTSERKWVKPSGEVIFWEATANPIRDAGGNIVSCLEIARNITERKKAEQALADEATRRRILIDQSRDGIVILDENGKVYEANQQFAEMLGYTPEETAQLHVWDWDTQWTHEELLEMIRSVDAAGDRFETYHRRKDGTTIDVEISTNGAICAGQKLIFCVCRDITERKQAEEALKESEKYLKTLFDATTGGILVIDPQTHKIVDANPAISQMIGTPRDQIIGNVCHQFVCPAEVGKCPITDLKQKIDTSERVILNAKGEEISVLKSVVPITRQGRRYLLELVFDITERKKREQLQHDENYVLTLLGQGAELSELLDAILRLGEQHDPSIKGSVLLFDPSKELLFQASAPSLPDDYKELFENGIPIGPKSGSCGTAAYRKERVIVTDIAKSPLFKPVEEVVKRAVNNSLLAGWSQPIIASSGDLFGTIANYSNKVGKPSAENLKVLEWSARVAAIAIERKRAEEALRQSKKKYKNLAEATSDMIWEADEGGTFTFVSPRIKDILGYEAKEVIDKIKTLDLTTKAEAQKWLKRFKEINAKKEPFFGFEITHLHKNGTPVLFEISGIPTFDNAGNFKGYVGVNKDITERKQAEEALKESDKRFRDIAENALEWIWEADVSGKYTYASPIVEKILGYKPEELPEKHFYDLFHPDDRQELKKAAFEAFAQKRPFRQFENRNLHKNGEIVWLSTSGVPILDEGGNLLGYRGADVDITERKRAEDALRESEERYRTVIEGAHDMIQSVALDGSINFVNQAWLDALGYTEADLPHLNLFDIICPDSLPHCQEMFARVVSGEPVHNVQATFLTKDGRKILVEGNAAPRYIGEKVVATQGIFRDITERKQMEGQLQEKHEQLDAQNEELRTINEELQATEEELQHSQEKLERMFESVTDGIVVADLDSIITKVNERSVQMHGFASEDDMLGRNAFDLVTPRDHERIAADIRQALKEGLIRGGEYTMLRVDGSDFPGELSTSVLKDSRGNVIGHISIARDITERKQAEEREKQLEQELNLAGRLASIGQLAAGVAHEINNPLTGVIGFSHLMMNRNIPNDMKEDLQVINSEALRVAKIVENLLVFAHQRKTGREYVFINDIITKVLELRAYEMKVNNIEVETRLDPNLPLTMADTGQLQQVFLNIVLNAEYSMKKAHHKGNLLVKTEQINGNIRASLTDNGAGISRENLDKIFNPFFTTKEVGKGTGLGLSICHGIITQHKGRIYAQSESGKGATFVIELPIVAEPAQADKAKKTQKEPQKPRGAKILVVDDEEAILTFLRRLLTEWGHSVETINNADAALERLKTERYSLILLDIKLPGMSGIELYRHIEEIAPALTRRVMFITGDIMEGTTRDFLEKAGVPHITKPIDIEELKKMMNNALNQTQVAAKASG